MGDDTSFENNAELHRLRRENSELRTRVAQLESGSASQSMASLTLDGRANLDIPFEDLEMDQQIGGGAHLRVLIRITLPRQWVLDASPGHDQGVRMFVLGVRRPALPRTLT
jgi:hypothetical protein